MVPYRRLFPHRGWLRYISLVILVAFLLKGCALWQSPSAPAPTQSSTTQAIASPLSTHPSAPFTAQGSPSGDTLPTFTPPAETFADRARELIEYHATHAPNRDRNEDPTGYAKSGVYTAMAQYAIGSVEQANQLTDYLFAHPKGASMFLAMAGMDLYLRYQEQMPQVLKQEVRRFITSFDDYTGGSTENHGIMFATAGYLAAQTWPDWAEADAVKRETQAHLFEFIEEIPQHGITEYDSPIYHVFFINSLLSLHDHATDLEMQQKATIGLELLLASMAPEWLQGYWASSSLRAGAFTHDPRRISSLTGPVGWLYWGGSEMPIPEDGCAVMSAVSDYRLPPVLQYIGQDRRVPYVHRETQGRDFNDEAKYRKYTYVDQDYAVYSQFDGNGELAWSDQLQRMGVVWVSPHPGSTFVIKHPIKGVRGDTADGQVLQHEKAMIGVYKDTLNGYLPATDAILEKIEAGDWLFLHGGTLLMGVKVINGYTWQDPVDVSGTPFSLFHSDAQRNGVVIQTARAQEFPGSSAKAVLENFSEAVKTRTEIDASGVNRNRPRLRFKTLSGDVLEIEFSGDRKVNDQVIDYSRWPLMENPWMRSEAGRFLELRHGDNRRYYDFRTWKIQ